MHRKIRFLALTICVAVSFLTAAIAVADDRFLSVIDDLPLMPALTEIDGSAVTFSKPGGRIVDVAASGRTETARVLVYYAKTLPQLGWRSAGAAIWERDDERLRLGFEEKGEELIVQFSLSPK